MVKTESASDLKLNFIHLITQISDYQQLKSLYALVQSQLKATTIPESVVDRFELGRVEIRNGVTKDQIFAEQGKQSITFQEVQTIMGNEPCEQSLDELLAALD